VLGDADLQLAQWERELQAEKGERHA
jgi:hypothetical protein